MEGVDQTPVLELYQEMVAIFGRKQINLLDP
jgi:hypothetical protein